MTVREIRLVGDPILKSATAKVVDFEKAKDLVRDLMDTTALPGRAGVAATQIGVGLSVFAYNIQGKIGYLINPELTWVGGQLELMDEGCLSVPGLWHKTPRNTRARAKGYLLDGSEIEVEGEGLLAQALQHEIDHLSGILYLDRLLPEQRKEAFRELRQQSWFL